MSSLPAISANKTNTCPHGLPPGACPICSGMGGGGNKSQSIDKPRRAGEMSYAECYQIWQMMKAAKAQKEQQARLLEQNLAMQAKLSDQLANTVSKLQNFLNVLSDSLPPALQKPFSALVNSVVAPILKILEKLPQIIKNIETFVENLKQKLYAAAEKLAAVFGEIKNFLNKKVSEKFKKFAKKVYKLFTFWNLEEEDFDKDEAIKEEISIFKAVELKNLKKLLETITTKKKKEDKDAAVSAEL